MGWHHQEGAGRLGVTAPVTPVVAPAVASVAFSCSNWCSYAVTRTVSCLVQNGTFLQRVFQGCRWPLPCSGGSYRAVVRPAYRVALRTVTALEWRCCPGHGGAACEEGGRGNGGVPGTLHPTFSSLGCLNCSRVGELTARLATLEAQVARLSVAEAPPSPAPKGADTGRLWGSPAAQGSPGDEGPMGLPGPPGPDVSAGRILGLGGARLCLGVPPRADGTAAVIAQGRAGAPGAAGPRGDKGDRVSAGSRGGLSWHPWVPPLSSHRLCPLSPPPFHTGSPGTPRQPWPGRGAGTWPPPGGTGLCWGAGGPPLPAPPLPVLLLSVLQGEPGPKGEPGDKGTWGEGLHQLREALKILAERVLILETMIGLYGE
uniref:EMI domain-containing protein n=1 Tax=Anas platyrhynchos TaxID=8839 RepID=A0A8B9SXC8_ANAPL